MSSPIKNSKLKPKMPGMPQLIVDPQPGNRVGPNPPKLRKKPRVPNPGLGRNGNIMKPLPIREKSGIPNGPTVGKVYKTY